MNKKFIFSVIIFVLSVLFIYSINGPARVGGEVFTPNYFAMLTYATPGLMALLLFPKYISIIADPGSVYTLINYLVVFYSIPFLLLYFFFLRKDMFVEAKKYLESIKLIFDFLLLLFSIPLSILMVLSLTITPFFSFFVVSVSSPLLIVIGNYLLILGYDSIKENFSFDKKVFTYIFICIFVISFTWLSFFIVHIRALEKDTITTKDILVQKLREPKVDSITLTEFNISRGKIRNDPSWDDRRSDFVKNISPRLQYDTEDYIEARTSTHYCSTCEDLRQENIKKTREDISRDLILKNTFEEIESICEAKVEIVLYEFYNQNRKYEYYSLMFLGDTLIWKNEYLDSDKISKNQSGEVTMCGHTLSLLTQAVLFVKDPKDKDNNKWNSLDSDQVGSLPEQDKILLLLKNYLDSLQIEEKQKEDLFKKLQ